MQYFILKAVGYVYDHPIDNGPNMKLNNMYGNTRMEWMLYHGNLKFSPPHMNSVLVETWEDFKPSSTKIVQKYSNETHLTPLSPPDIGKNHQACLVCTQQSNLYKVDDIGRIEKAIIEPI